MVLNIRYSCTSFRDYDYQNDSMKGSFFILIGRISPVEAGHEQVLSRTCCFPAMALFLREIRSERSGDLSTERGVEPAATGYHV
jgi:hypothetical protein